MSRDIPILFSAPMVRAILAGTKTQTRRAMRDQPCELLDFNRGGLSIRVRGAVYQAFSPTLPPVRCPYGRTGDRLWVREAWRAAAVLDSSPPRDIPSDSRIWHEADDSVSGLRGLVRMGKLRPGMFMPRWASRITLEVTGVRVERLQDITEADALAEGIVPGYGGFGLADGSHFHAADPRQSYLGLWEAINGPGSVEANPWVWSVTFRRVQ